MRWHDFKKLEVKSRQQVTFSKRRAGLFNKAAELSILCGFEMAILVFSSTGKVYTFGHPHVESLLDRFLTGNLALPKPAEAYLPLEKLNHEIEKAAAELESERMRTTEAAKRRRNREGFWWDEAMEDMKMEEVKRFRLALVKLRGKVEERREKVMGVKNGGGVVMAPPMSFATEIEGFL